MPLSLRGLARAKSPVGWCLESPGPHSPQGHREPRPAGDQGWSEKGEGEAEADTDTVLGRVLAWVPGGRRGVCLSLPQLRQGRRTPGEQELCPTSENTPITT